MPLIFSHFRLTDNKIAPIPLEDNIRLTPIDGAPLRDTPPLHRQLVRNLVYVTVTYPNIAHAVHIVSQFMAAPRSMHYTSILWILCYIKGTLFYALHFSV